MVFEASLSGDVFLFNVHRIPSWATSLGIHRCPQYWTNWIFWFYASLLLALLGHNCKAEYMSWSFWTFCECTIERTCKGFQKRTYPFGTVAQGTCMGFRQKGSRRSLSLSPPLWRRRTMETLNCWAAVQVKWQWIWRPKEHGTRRMGEETKESTKTQKLDIVCSSSHDWNMTASFGICAYC